MNDLLDAEIAEFYRAVFNHAFELAQEFPEEKDPNNIFDPCNADDVIKLKEAIAKKIEETNDQWRLKMLAGEIDTADLFIEARRP